MTGIDAKRILIVDDDQDLTTSLMAVFVENGYDLRTASSAEEAIESITTWPPDLALVDVALPGMNGLEFAMALRKAQPDCRVVLFSGQPSSEELMEQSAREGHFFEFLAKPLHPLFMLDYVASRLAARPSGKLAD